MATVTDVEVANQSFPNVRQDLNDILEALATNFSADAEPTTTYPNQFWYETDTNLLYIRNEANDAWVTLASINQTSGEWEPRTAIIQAIDSAGLALKTDDGTTRFSISDAGVVSFENYAFPSADGTAGQVLQTDGAGNLTFESGGAGDKIEEGNSSVEVVDTGTGYVAVTVDGSETARFDANGRLGIGTTSPSAPLTVDGNTLLTSGGLHYFGATSGTDRAYVGWGNGTGMAIWNVQNSFMQFGTNNAERMRITSGGELLLATTSNPYGCQMNIGPIGIDGICIASNSTSITMSQMLFANPNGIVGTIQTSGSSTSYNTSSDYRLKENIVDMTGAIDRVKALKPSQFNFIADPNKTVDGFIAHEVQTIVPEAISGEKDAMRIEEYEVTPAVLDEDGNVVTEAVMGEREVPDYQGIDQSKLVPLLTGALQEAIAKIEALEARVSALET